MLRAMSNASDTTTRETIRVQRSGRRARSYGSSANWLACGLALACACSDVAPQQHPPQLMAAPYGNWPNPLANMAHGAEQTARVCRRTADDLVHALFCSGAMTQVAGLSELQSALGVGSESVRSVVSAPGGDFVGLALTGHSTGLVARSVSAINPRLIAVHFQNDPFQMIAVGFARGEQFAEIVTRDRSDDSLRFYLVSFRLPCNAGAQGCTPGDLLTPAIERDWTEVSVYDETDLQNTALDCAPCHQPLGPGTPKLLRMQELNAPWTHWFWEGSEGGRALFADYYAAKGDEPLAGMTARQLDETNPSTLSTLAGLANPTQPNKFDSPRIENEVRMSAAALGGDQPTDNAIPGQSATWRLAYERAQRGEAIPVPYHDVKVTDPTKLANMTAAYQAFRREELDLSLLPDVRDVFVDDPQLRAELGIGTEPGLDGAATLLEACAMCHNARLDQQLSRARFRADLQGMSRDEKDLAIDRLLLPPDDLLAMPPARLRVLSTEARRLAIETLRQ